MAWHTVERIAEDTYRIYEPMGAIMPSLGISSVNTYMVVGDERAALIDSGMGVGDVRGEIARITDLPCTVLNTHYHWDHVGANALFEESAIHEAEAEALAQEQHLGAFRKAFRSASSRGVLPPSFDVNSYRIVPPTATRVLRDGDVIDLGGRLIQALHTPGHSPGHTTYLDAANCLLFTGDTAYEGPVFACFEGGDPQAFAHTADRLAALPGPLTACPGHNDVIVDPDWLAWFARCVGDAVDGMAKGVVKEGLVLGRVFTFGAMSVWLSP